MNILKSMLSILSMPSPQASAEIYQVLLTNSDSDSDVALPKVPPSNGQRDSVISTIALLGCLLCTISNILMVRNFSNGVSFPSRTSFFPTKILTQKDIASLRRPSQFIGLEQIYKKNSPSHGMNFSNYPIVLAPVDSSSPFRTFGHDPISRKTNIGTISPEDRQLKVTHTVSTVIQFRTIDFGMEHCELVIRMNLQSINSSMFSSLDLFAVESNAPLRSDQLSYSTRPPRIERVAEISELVDGQNTLYSFDCKTDELFTFELACSRKTRSSSCSLEWWQNREDPNPALVVIQSAKLGTEYTDM